ncbi:hypothetical protein ABPG75_012552 [Micractinium tetrahymenae]
MGNSLCRGGGPAVKPAHPNKSMSRSGSATSRISGASKAGLGLSASLGRLSAAVKKRSAAARSKADAANSRHRLEERLAEAIMAKKEGDASAPGPQVKFNRLLLRFGTLHEGFAACRAVFRQLCGSEDGELSLEQLRTACTQLGYHADDASLQRIFASADIDGSRSLNVHEFLAVLAILHILKGPEGEERVDPAILKTLNTAEQAFMCFSSSRRGYIEKGELLSMMHEGPTDGVRHSANGSGSDPIRGIAQRRFAELDRDGRGRVSFLEFLFCLEGWVEDAEEVA